MGCNTYHNAELLKCQKRQRQSSSVSSISFFSLIFLMERAVLAWPTLVTQTAVFSAVMWANNNLLYFIPCNARQASLMEN